MIPDLALDFLKFAAAFVVTCVVGGGVVTLALHFGLPGLYPDGVFTKEQMMFGLTRDSVALVWAQILSALVTVAGVIVDPAIGLLDPSFLGVSETTVHRVMAVAVLILALSNKLGSSPLGAKKDQPAPVPFPPNAAALFIAVALGLSSMACGKIPVQPPAGTYDAATQRKYQVDQALKALDAVVNTARNLNGVSGKMHLSDRDTAIVLKSADAFGVALTDYAKGASQLAILRTALDTFVGSLTVDAKQHPTLAPLLSAVMAIINGVSL